MSSHIQSAGASHPSSPSPSYTSSTPSMRFVGVDTTGLTPKKCIEISFDLFNTSIRQGFATSPSEVSYQDHIAKSHQAIISASQSHESRDSVVVLGVGPLEPIDILVQRYAHVILVDYDSQNLEAIRDSLPSDQQSKLRLIKKDLTGGAYQKIQTVFEQVLQMKAGHTNAACIDALLTQCTQVLSSHIPPEKLSFTKGDQTDEVAEVDFVISSLVASQLEFYLKKTIENFIRLNLDITILKIDDYLNDSSNPVKKQCLAALRIFNENMRKTHFVHLANLVNERGSVYFADTLSTAAADPCAQEEHSTATKQLMSQAKFKITELGQWIWRPKNHFDRPVRAYLLQKPHTNSNWFCHIL